MTKALVVGYGSIGQRHTRLLKQLNCAVAVCSRRSLDAETTDIDSSYADLGIALADWQPDYVVVANRTHEHYPTLQYLGQQDFTGTVLVEKPLFHHPCHPPKHSFQRLAVAYNLRFHPLLQSLHRLLSRQSGIAAHIYVGQYLPQWRPTVDYRQSYSAYRNQGGGVLRDLSHELDYALWLFGAWKRLTAAGGHLSALEIDSDDVFSLILETPSYPLVSIHLDYLSRLPRREIVILTNQQTISVDLIRGTLMIDETLETFEIPRDQTYLAEHQAVIAGDETYLCSVESAMAVLQTIDCAEQAALTHTWISR
ncbi:MAG: Gfo/Idh/MocA family oxidoreductase [Cyanobacteria bacterium P01_A01_bin.123]